MNQDHIGASRKVLAQGSEICDLFEHNVGPQIDDVCNAVDSALVAIATFDLQVVRLQKPKRDQCALMIHLFGKALTDILGAVELLRRGYDELCLNVMRSAMESWATAVVIGCDPEVGRQFVEGRYSTNGSIRRILGNKALGLDPEQKRHLAETYRALHKFAHPTALSLSAIVGAKGLYLGGRIIETRIEDYRHILAGCAQMARNIEGAVPKPPKSTR